MASWRFECVNIAPCRAFWAGLFFYLHMSHSPINITVGQRLFLKEAARQIVFVFVIHATCRQTLLRDEVRLRWMMSICFVEIVLHATSLSKDQDYWHAAGMTLSRLQFCIMNKLVLNNEKACIHLLLDCFSTHQINEIRAIIHISKSCKWSICPLNA